MVLKRLADAQADGDRILAVVRGTAVNQDGRSGGLTAPSGAAQEAVIRAGARATRAVARTRSSYVEAHGTGTSLGDPIEVQALGAALGQAPRARTGRCSLGAVKTNIGHLEAAAGIAGVIKVVLALQHGEIPPQPHVTRLNPYIPWDRLTSPCPRELTPWTAERRTAHRRRELLRVQRHERARRPRGGAAGVGAGRRQRGRGRYTS